MRVHTLSQPCLCLLALLGLISSSSQAQCVPDATSLCLENSRFEVSATWQVSADSTGEAQARTLTDDTGYFWFFSEDNVEVMVKVLDGCTISNSFWVFAAGLTNVEVELRVHDHLSGETRQYRNPPLQAFLPIQDTAAFQTCTVEPPPVAEDWNRDLLHADLQFDLSTRRGSARIVLAPSSSKAVSFSVGDLQIQEVRHAFGALNFRADNGELHVGVPDLGEEIDIVIDYAFQEHFDFDGYLNRGQPFLWPYFCGNLYPCNPDPAEGLTFSLEILNPPPGQQAIFPSQIPSPAPPYMVAFAVGDYEYQSLGMTPSGTEVGIWFLPDGRSQAVNGTRNLLALFTWLEETLGPYPFGDKVAPVAVEWGSGGFGGIEHHPFWHIASADMRDRVLQLHEAAHGWFGNGVRIRCWEDFVLSEGVASYLAARTIEAVEGPQAGGEVWSRYRITLDTVVAQRNTIAWPEGCGEIDILHDQLFSLIPYMKGAFFLKAVEGEVGRASLDAALGAFFRRFEGRAAGMQDLIDVLREETGFDPAELAKKWLRELGIPPG